MAGGKRQASPAAHPADFLAECEVWREFESQRQALAGVLAAADAALDAEAERVQRERAEYDAAVNAAALGEGPAPLGDRPSVAPALGEAAAIARQRLQQHNSKRVEVEAACAGAVVASAKSWWASEAEAVARAVQQVQEVAERASEALSQVRRVRAAEDSLEAAERGLVAHRPRSQRVPATIEPADVVQMVSAGASNPFDQPAPEPPRSRIERVAEHNLGMQSWEETEVIAPRNPQRISRPSWSGNTRDLL